ncbi:MAG: glycosyltransferase family 39 protein [Chloroflexota bacterium]
MKSNGLIAGGLWRWSMVAVLLLGFFLRVYRIGEQRVWWDEGWSVWVARFPATEILRQTGNDVHPPLYFELLHVWRLMSGDGEGELRLLSAFLGTLTIALTYALGRGVARGVLSAGQAQAAGLLAAIFLTVSRFAVAWSQEIRMYALATALGVLAVWAARQVWDRGRPLHMAVYIVATTAGLYTLYLFAPIWLAVNIAWLWVLHQAANRRREFLRWAALQAAVLALFLPWMFYAAGGFLSTASATPVRLFDFVHIYWTVLTVGIPVDVGQFNRLTLPALAVFLSAVLALLAFAVRPSTNQPAAGHQPSAAHFATRRDLTLLLSVLVLPAIIVYIVSLPRQDFYNPPFNPRYLVIFTPFYSIVLGWGLVMLGRFARSQGFSHTAAGTITASLAVYMIAVAYAGLSPYHPGRVLIDDFPSLVSTIDAYRRPNDAVVLYSDTDWPIFAYHHPQPWRGVPHQWLVTPETADSYLTPIWETHDAIWLVTTPYSGGGDPQRHFPAWLAEKAEVIQEYTYKDMALTLYARTNERAAVAGRLSQPDPPQPLDIPLSSGGRLLGYSQAARDFKSGDAIHLFLFHQGNGLTSVEVGLIDAAGQVWGNVPLTLPPTAETARQQVDILVPPEAPAGRYRFYVLAEDLLPAEFGNLSLQQKQAEYLFESDVTIANRLDAPFGDGIRLLGYDLATPVARPGETVGLTLYWSSDGDIRQRYKVFTHLLGETFNAATGNFLWGQSDNEPSGNTRPTTTWRGAEVIVDQHAIPVAADASPGTYRLEVGLYDPLSGARLPLLGGDSMPVDDHLILTTVEVAP